MKRYFVLTLAVLSFSCQNRKKDFLEINNLWMLVGSDSTYYDFYFDDEEQFYYDSKKNRSYIVEKFNLSDFESFQNEMHTNITSLEDSISVFKYVSSNIIKNKKFIRIEPIGSFIYKFSKDKNYNYFLYGIDASERFLLYQKFNCVKYPEYRDVLTDSIYEDIDTIKIR